MHDCEFKTHCYISFPLKVDFYYFVSFLDLEPFNVAQICIDFIDEARSKLFPKKSVSWCIYKLELELEFANLFKSKHYWILYKLSLFIYNLEIGCTMNHAILLFRSLFQKHTIDLQIGFSLGAYFAANWQTLNAFWLFVGFIDRNAGQLFT